jgi:hypothetical protein
MLVKRESSYLIYKNDMDYWMFERRRGKGKAERKKDIVLFPEY